MIPRHVVLLGMMGSGKTTVGELLAAQINRPYCDSDREIERITGRTGRQSQSTTASTNFTAWKRTCC